jgi:hypothetical protein
MGVGRGLGSGGEEGGTGIAHGLAGAQRAGSGAD